MDTVEIIREFNDPETKAFEILVTHSKLVAEKAIEIAERVIHLKPDLNFIKEAAMLHDIGILLVNLPDIGCFGEYQYVCHGYLGREILDKKGLHRHALVCERHIVAGISAKEIKKRNLPIPARDMVPITLEEKIICFADKFYSKKSESLSKIKTIKEITDMLKLYGGDIQVNRFKDWLTFFNEK